MTVETLLILQSTQISFSRFMHSSSRFWKAIMSFCTGFTYFSVNEFNNILQTKICFSYLQSYTLSLSKTSTKALSLQYHHSNKQRFSLYIFHAHREIHKKLLYNWHTHINFAFYLMHVEKILPFATLSLHLSRKSYEK